MLLPELKQLESLLISFLGNPKNTLDENLQLQFPCPRCIEEKGHNEANKYNLEITLAKGLFSKGGLFQCWSCGAVDDDMKGGVYKLIKLYGGRETLREYKAIVTSIKESGLFKLPEYNSNVFEENEFYLTLPTTYTKIKNIENTPDEVKKYLNKRRITQDIVTKFNIGYTTKEEMKPSYRNRIIIPSYDENGELNFWLGRDFTGNDKRIKYCNCDIKKTEVVYQESHLQWDADIYLVEGGLDAIYANNTTAFLGKTLSKDDELYKVLMERANANVIICLDGDTDIHETLKIYKILNTGRLKGKIRYIRPRTYKDFGEAYEGGGKQAIIDLMKSQHTFTEFECASGIIE